MKLRLTLIAIVMIGGLTACGTHSDPYAQWRGSASRYCASEYGAQSKAVFWTEQKEDGTSEVLSRCTHSPDVGEVMTPHDVVVSSTRIER